MSKLDAQRAMRAAKYDAAHGASSTRSPARPAAGAAATPGATKTPARSRTKAPVVVVTADDEAVPELCGHRSMAGKSCKRPAGHPETNHRYT
jgi:hypothetical protein